MCVCVYLYIHTLGMDKKEQHIEYTKIRRQSPFYSLFIKLIT